MLCQLEWHLACVQAHIKVKEKLRYEDKKGGNSCPLSGILSIPGGLKNKGATPSSSFPSLIYFWTKGHVSSQSHKQLVMEVTGFSF